MSNDNVKDAQGIYNVTEVLPPEDPIPSSLAAIPSPPSGLVKSSFWTALSYKAQQKALAAYNEAYAEVRRTISERRLLNDELLEYMRSAHRLDNVSDYLEVDDRDRKRQLLESKEQHDEAEHQAYIRKQQRQREKMKADAEHAAFLSGQHHSNSNLSDEESEVIERIRGRALGPGRIRADIERYIETILARSGGKPSAANTAEIEALRATCEEIIQDTYGD